jgi:uncharacterized protein YneF (UPF0154 family)
VALPLGFDLDLTLVDLGLTLVAAFLAGLALGFFFAALVMDHCIGPTPGGGA